MQQQRQDESVAPHQTGSDCSMQERGGGGGAGNLDMAAIGWDVAPYVAHDGNGVLTGTAQFSISNTFSKDFASGDEVYKEAY